MGIFSKFMKKVQGSEDEDMYGEAEEEYVELDTEHHESSAKIMIRPFVLNDFEDIKPILDSLRKGKTIGLINIKPLKDKDIIELKRSINKLKKTCDAVDGELAGFGEDYIVVTPSFAQIYKSKEVKDPHKQAERPSQQQGAQPSSPEPEPEIVGDSK